MQKYGKPHKPFFVDGNIVNVVQYIQVNYNYACLFKRADLILKVY